MEDGRIFLWSDFHDLISLKKYYKAFGPLTKCKPSVTKNNDHAPKIECVFSNICAKREVSKKESLKFDHYFSLFCLHLLFPKKNH
jgi:hypothetical protein